MFNGFPVNDFAGLISSTILSKSILITFGVNTVCVKEVKNVRIAPNRPIAF